MDVEKFLHTIDGISTWTGKAAAWLVVGLMALVCAEVFKRYMKVRPRCHRRAMPTQARSC